MGYPFNYDYHLAHPSEIKSLRSSAEMEAFKRVDSLYPDVLLEREAIEKLACSICEKRLSQKTSRMIAHTNDPEKYRRIFIPTFVRSYIKAVEKKGGKVRDAQAPLATPSNTETSQDSETTLKRIERKTIGYIYYIYYIIKSSLRIYKNHIKSRGLYWSIIYRFYKIATMRRILIPIVNILKPEHVMIEGHKMKIDKWDTVVSQELIVSGKWEAYETELFKKHIKPGDIVVDIGAHIGYYTLIAARLVGDNGKVYAFEPDPKNFQILEKNVAQNGYHNVVLVNKAVADKSGNARLFLNSENSGDHRIFESDHGRKSVAITTTTLDDFFTNKDNEVDLIKMDIQGAEARAFQGSTRTLAKNKHITLITEFYPKALQQSGKNAEEYLALLQENDFRLFEIDEVKRTTRPVTSKQLLISYPIASEKLTNLLCVR
jgi:FkbM family methyltransferase